MAKTSQQRAADRRAKRTESLLDSGSKTAVRNARLLAEIEAERRPQPRSLKDIRREKGQL